jgi:uncharacterized protein
MKLDVRELVEPSGRFAGEEAVTVDDPVAGEIAVPCRVEVEYRNHGIVYLSGTVAATLLTQCHRCLDPVRRDLTGDFELMVRRGDDVSEEGDDVVTLGPHEYEVDLGPYVHEAIALSAPMVIVCREDCRGLCPSCGANRNRETCTCRPNADSRWDALRKLS